MIFCWSRNHAKRSVILQKPAEAIKRIPPTDEKKVYSNSKFEMLHMNKTKSSHFKLYSFLPGKPLIAEQICVAKFLQPYLIFGTQSLEYEVRRQSFDFLDWETETWEFFFLTTMCFSSSKLEHSATSAFMQKQIEERQG